MLSGHDSRESIDPRQALRRRRLQRTEPKSPGRIAGDDEIHEPVAEVADAVKQITDEW